MVAAGSKEKHGRALDTHLKRERHIQLGLEEAEKYTAAYMKGKPTIKELMKGGSSHFDKARAC